MIHGYDHWKQTNPDDLLDYGEPPEVWVECEACCGEGSITHNEPMGSRWAIDPPGTYDVVCEACQGAGGFIEEAEGDR